MRQEEKNISGAEVRNLYINLEKRDIKVWIDGGWAADALLGQETRPHGDLDIALQHKDIENFREYMKSFGFFEIERPEDKKWSFVMGDNFGHELDVHSFSFDQDGNIVESEEYPRGSLEGKGVICGQLVRCISPEFLIQSKLRHTPREKDYQDIKLICEKFSLEIPEQYKG